MLITLVMSVPMAILWMIFARQFSLEGLVVGYILGFGVLFVIRINTTFPEEDEPIRLHRIPFQIFALIWHIIRLSIDVIVSGIDVGRRVLPPKMPIDTVMHRISTQDADNNGLISALSGHAITITPGEMVIDYETDDNGQTIMLVHCLDKKLSTEEKLKADQKQRLKLIRQILGHDIPEEE